MTVRARESTLHMVAKTSQRVMISSSHLVAIGDVIRGIYCHSSFPVWDLVGVFRMESDLSPPIDVVFFDSIKEVKS